MPFVEQEKYQISRKCRLHPENDIFRDQEENKIHVDINEWRCGYCRKIFRGEKFLDQHFDNRHYNLLNVVCGPCFLVLVDHTKYFFLLVAARSLCYVIREHFSSSTVLFHSFCCCFVVCFSIRGTRTFKKVLCPARDCWTQTRHSSWDTPHPVSPSSYKQYVYRKVKLDFVCFVSS